MSLTPAQTEVQETEGLSSLIESPCVSSDLPNTGSGRPEEDAGVLLHCSM